MGRHEAAAGSGSGPSSAGDASRLPRTVTLTAAISLLSALIIVLALLWTGTSLAAALLVAGGLLVVLGASGLLLRATGLLDALPSDADRN